MRYTITDHDGTIYGPVSAAELREWGDEGRLDATVAIRDEQSQGTFPGSVWRTLVASGSPAPGTEPRIGQIASSSGGTIFLPDLLVALLFGAISLGLAVPSLLSENNALFATLLQAALVLFACVFAVLGRKVGFILVLALLLNFQFPQAPIEFLAEMMEGPPDTTVVVSPYGYSSESAEIMALETNLRQKFSQYIYLVNTAFLAYAACRLFRAYGPEPR